MSKDILPYPIEVLKERVFTLGERLDKAEETIGWLRDLLRDALELLEDDGVLTIQKAELRRAIREELING